MEALLVIVTVTVLSITIMLSLLIPVYIWTNNDDTSFIAKIVAFWVIMAVLSIVLLSNGKPSTQKQAQCVTIKQTETGNVMWCPVVEEQE